MNSKDLHHHQILVVEDLTTDARLIERSFKRARIANSRVFLSDGEQAIDYLQGAGEFAGRTTTHPPVLILLDLKLPKKDGFFVLQWIRQQDVLKRIPIVVLTSSNRSHDVNRAYDSGANSYLVKPLEDDALVDMFRKLDMYWLMLNEPPELDSYQRNNPP